MAAITTNSDIYQEQTDALADSSKMLRDGTRLTGNVQVAIARYVATGVHATSDVITVPLVKLPKGVRIVPGLCSFVPTSGGTYDVVVYNCDNTINFLSGDQTGVNPIITSDAQVFTTKQCDIEAEITLGAELPADFEAVVTIAYAAPS